MALAPGRLAVGVFALAILGIVGAAAVSILNAQNPVPVALDAAIRPSPYERDTVVDKVAWRENYVDVNASLTNQTGVTLLNLDFNVTSDLFLAWCVERSHVDGVQILTRPLIQTFVTIPGRNQVDQYVHMNYKSYHVACQRLPARQSLSLLVVPVGGELEFAPKQNPRFLEASGTYQLEGSGATVSFHLRHDF